MADPRPAEFRRFIELLTADAPDGYRPWLFRVEEGTKAPDTSFGSWKSERARISPEQAIKWMKRGGNVGIAGRPDDPLINVDIDDEDETTPDDLKPTLIARSRSRTGVHAWYFEDTSGEEIANIPTDDAGEVRANWQYVVAPGSYVESDDVNADDLPAGQRDDVGYYTVAREDPVAHLRYDELPAVFRDQQTADAADDVELVDDGQRESPSLEDFEQPDSAERDGESALFDIEARDIILKEDGGSTDPSERWASVFHDSGTESNMSYSGEGLLHCWRHEVAHNGLQALAVLSDYDGSCADIGSAHKRSGAGRSCLEREEGAHIWHAWKYAKRNGYIPDDDPVPYVALKHLCRERDLCTVTDLPDGPDESIPAHAYDAALATIENNEELNSGRDRTDEFTDDEGSAPAPDTPDDGASAEPETDDEVDEWAAIRQRLREASDADERELPRFDAAMKLHNGHDFLTLEENDQLYVYDDDTGIYNDTGEQFVRSQLTDGLEEQYRAHAMSEALDHIRGRTMITQDDIGGPAGYVAAENCVIDLDAGEGRDHGPEYRFLSRLGCAYDPDADAPRFRAFLKQVVPKESDRKKLQEYAGYTLMHWALPHHKALFLVGPTASGKSTFLDTINAMLGEDTVASLTPQQLTGERFSGAELFEKWANIRNDIPAATVENTGMFKEIIGGDPMKAERKRKDPFMFEPTAKHLFAANELPSTETDDEAFYRRILLVPFPETVPVAERDKHLDDKLQAELPGVLNWALQGYDRLQQQGGFTADRTPGQTQETWQKWADSVSRFEKAALTEGDDAIAKSDVYAAYLEYCRQEGIPSDTQHSMTRSLKQQGYEDGRTYVDGEQQRVFLQTRLSSRGKQLLDDARDRGSSDSSDGGRGTGLGDY